MQFFYLDAPSLALGRMVLGILLLSDLLGRAPNLEAHYSDAGVLPRAAFQLRHWDFLWSVHALSGSTRFEGLLFGLSAVFALTLLVGYRTFASTLCSWALLVSLHGRNPFLRDGQDDLLRVILFWCLFLPLGARFSLDARQGRSPNPLYRGFTADTTRIISMGSVCLILQICLVYWVGGISKLQSEWWTQGEGAFLSLSIGRYETVFGQFLLNFPGLLRGLNFATIAAELIGPLLLFIPTRGSSLRGLAVVLFMSLHLAFALCLRLGIFPYVGILAWVFILPSSVWERAATWSPIFSASGQPPRVREVVPAWRYLVSSVAVMSLLLVIWLNVQYVAEIDIPRWVTISGEALGLQQYWSIFSPRKKTPAVMADGWFIARGVLEDQEQVNLSGIELSWTRPSLISKTFQDTRWRHYLANLMRIYPRYTFQRDTVERNRVAYLEWLCRHWNQAHPPKKRARWVSLYLMGYPLGTHQTASRALLTQTICGDL